jgi:hypothetical protein
MNSFALLLLKRASMGALLCVLSVAGASGQTNGGSLVRQVADGKPWAMTMLPRNRQAMVTLNPDGTGKMEGGPMTMSPTWRATPDGLCLKPTILMAERCVTLMREGRAIVGLRDGIAQFRLER